MWFDLAKGLSFFAADDVLAYPFLSLFPTPHLLILHSVLRVPNKIARR
ncbi:MAG TPA: hypothetical protein VKK81_08130 [Candidatus Binatia bacterium]|nr:hypothetical protein [Candidatus Binatia bacterium]